MPVLPGAEPSTAESSGPIGRTGVVVHGSTGTVQSVRPRAQHLAAAGLAVRAPLLPGHGATGQEPSRARRPRRHGEVVATLGHDAPLVPEGTVASTREHARAASAS